MTMQNYHAIKSKIAVHKKVYNGSICTASLSSQSSRDGSPTGLTGGVRKAVVDLHYNWPTVSGLLLKFY